jgi:HSP20 family protein
MIARATFAPRAATPAFALLDDIFQAASRAAPARSIPMQVVESAEAYTLKASLPGLAKDEISIEIDGSTLTLSAERKTSPLEEGQSSLLSELPVGPVRRSIAFPQEINSQSSHAKFENGVLVAILPKVSPSKTSLKID